MSFGPTTRTLYPPVGRFEDTRHNSCFNEELGVELTTSDVLVVDDGLWDGTPEIVYWRRDHS